VAKDWRIIFLTTWIQTQISVLEPLVLQDWAPQYFHPTFPHSPGLDISTFQVWGGVALKTCPQFYEPQSSLHLHLMFICTRDQNSLWANPASLINWEPRVGQWRGNALLCLFRRVPSQSRWVIQRSESNTQPLLPPWFLPAEGDLAHREGHFQKTYKEDFRPPGSQWSEQMCVGFWS
jgi:hypothetical protein